MKSIAGASDSLGQELDVDSLLLIGGTFALPHFATAMLAKLDSDALAGYVAPRKTEGAGNRTVNIEVGVLRRVLKQYRMWQFVSDGYQSLPEPKNIGRGRRVLLEEFLTFFDARVDSAPNLQGPSPS
jgi:hypothetical protein